MGMQKKKASEICSHEFEEVREGYDIYNCYLHIYECLQCKKLCVKKEYVVK